MKVAMGKSGVFDSTFFSSPIAVLFDGDVESKKVCFAFEELGFDSVVIKSLFWSCWAVNCAFQLSSFLRIGIQTLMFIFFCPTTFLLTISAYSLVKLQPATEASLLLHTTLLALPRLLWTQTSDILVKALNDCSWEFNNFRVLYQNLVFIWHFRSLTHDWYFKKLILIAKSVNRSKRGYIYTFQQDADNCCV